jgi:hypothetical protein
MQEEDFQQLYFFVYSISGCSGQEPCCSIDNPNRYRVIAQWRTQSSLRHPGDPVSPPTFRFPRVLSGLISASLSRYGVISLFGVSAIRNLTTHLAVTL